MKLLFVSSQNFDILMTLIMTFQVNLMSYIKSTFDVIILTFYIIDHLQIRIFTNFKCHILLKSISTFYVVIISNVTIMIVYDLIISYDNLLSISTFCLNFDFLQLQSEEFLT